MMDVNLKQDGGFCMSSYLWRFMVTSLLYLLDKRLIPEDILYIGQHFLYIVHLGGIHTTLCISSQF